MGELANRFVEGRRGARALGVVMLGLSVFLLISLASYSPDSYPNASDVRYQARNWGGRIGADIAYGAFTGIGYAAYVLPLLCLVWGVGRWRGTPLIRTACRSAGVLSLGLLFCVATGLPRYSQQTAFALGGWLGTQTSTRLLIPYLGRPGAAILIGALVAAALVLTTDARLGPALRLVARGARLLRRAVLTVVGWPRRWMTGWRRYRAARHAARVAARELAALQAPAPSPEDREAEHDDPEPPETDEDAEVAAAQRQTPAPRVQIGGSGGGPPAAARPAGHREEPSAAVSAVAGNRSGVPRRGQRAGAQAAAGGRYRIPGVELLDDVPAGQGQVDEEVLLQKARQLEQALRNFDVSGKVVEVSPGPVVTRYEVEPAAGVKVNRIVTLADDLARVMSANGIRIQAPVPGKSVVGVEIANQDRETVYLRVILESRAFRQADSKLTMALGKTISGEPFVADLARMPHLLVAGATGSGKSVCINGLICSMLYKSTPDEVRFLMVDPKVVELTMYNEIPHLLVPVVTEPKKAAEALRWAVAEMEARYQKLARMGVRNLADYNRRAERLATEPDDDGVVPPSPLPCIVIVIDEFADLMLTAPADVETSLMALAQKSRAVGIHIILATQRPSVNVITGVIKANFPSRIAFQVATKTDSRTILDMNGAERLLGRGDMLYLPGGQGEPVRVHGAYVSGEETESLVEALKDTEYEAEEFAVFDGRADITAAASDQDELFEDAVQIVVEHQQASTSFLQRRMKVGYSRAARLMDELEHAGIVGPAEGAKPRQVLVDRETLAADGDEPA